MLRLWAGFHCNMRSNRCHTFVPRKLYEKVVTCRSLCSNVCTYLHIHTQYIYLHIEKFIFLFPKKPKTNLKQKTGPAKPNDIQRPIPSVQAVPWRPWPSWRISVYVVSAPKPREIGPLANGSKMGNRGVPGQSRLGKSPLFHDLC